MMILNCQITVSNVSSDTLKNEIQVRKSICAYSVYSSSLSSILIRLQAVFAKLQSNTIDPNTLGPKILIPVGLHSFHHSV